MKRWTIALLVAALLATAWSAALGEADYMGAPLADFTVETVDGDGFTLSKALETHDMVLINLWATWCPPCEKEFPYLEEAYEAYSDRVAVVALSIEPSDTPEKLREYADSHGMTFPVGSDAQTGLANHFGVMSIPTSVVVDRFGNVALVEAGMQDSAAKFEALFDWFLRDDYTETEVLHGFPEVLPKAERLSDERLGVAANAEGSDIPFSNPEDAVTWPMAVVETDGRVALASTNAGVEGSDCAVRAKVTASAGDALAFDFKISAQVALDRLYVSVDGEVVKSFSGEHEWTTWAIPLEAGEHEVAFGYEKGYYFSAGEDCAWIDDVRVASGDEAAALLATLPEYPVADAFEASISDGTQVAFDDPSGVVATFHADGGWIVGDAAAIQITLTAAQDPETAFLETEQGLLRLSDALSGDGEAYVLTVPVPETFTVVYAYPGADDEALSNVRGLILLNGEEGANAFEAYVEGYGYELDWRYAE